MKKVMLFALALLMGWSCQKDQEQLTPIDPVPEAELSFVVPVDEALQRLEVALDRIDGEVTRAGNRRMVTSIERVKAARALRGGTRTMGDQPALEDLFYIVSFGEGQGSAVLGADRRLESIYAILDETVLTAEDFNPPASTRSTLPTDDDSIRFVASEEELTDFITGMIVNAAFPDRPTIPNPGVPEVPRQHWERFIDTTANIHIAPSLKTKWDQEDPFNLLYDTYRNEEGDIVKYYAGCTPIAIAQFLLGVQLPGTNVINNVFFSWTALSRCEYGKSMSTTDSMYVATFVKTIADAVNANCRPEGTGAFLRSYTDELADAGITAEERVYTAPLVEYAVRDYGAICITGWATNTGERTGHSWVIDGIDALECYDVYRVVQDATGFIIEETRTALEGNHRLYHCNYGWSGLCDGYYTYSMFDTTEGPTAGYDPSIGDRYGIGSSNYNQDFTVLDYEL